MKERPISFLAWEADAVAAGRKTETRRLVRPQPELPEGPWYLAYTVSSTDQRMADTHGLYRGVWPNGESVWQKRCPYGRHGDTLWMREPRLQGPGFRHEARVLLRVTETRVHRIQEMTEEEAAAEGFSSLHDFRAAWDAGNRAHPWASNPWVWALRFKRLGAAT
jgi:hypothetical protein